MVYHQHNGKNIPIYFEALLLIEQSLHGYYMQPMRIRRDKADYMCSLEILIKSLGCFLTDIGNIGFDWDCLCDGLASILTLDGDGSIALSRPGNDLSVYGNTISLGSTATINPRI